MARQLIQSAQLLHLPIWFSAANEMALPKLRRVVGLFRRADLKVKG